MVKLTSSGVIRRSSYHRSHEFSPPRSIVYASTSELSHTSDDRVTAPSICFVHLRALAYQLTNSNFCFRHRQALLLQADPNTQRTLALKLCVWQKATSKLNFAESHEGSKRAEHGCCRSASANARRGEPTGGRGGRNGGPLAAAPVGISAGNGYIIPQHRRCRAGTCVAISGCRAPAR